MKRAIYLLIPLILLSFKSKERMTGKFFNHCAFDKIESFYFQKDGRFEYYAECTYEKYGKGTFQLTKDKLILNYLNSDSQEKGHFDIWVYKIATQYSDTIHLRIQDSKINMLLENVVIHFKDSQIANLTDTYGTVKIRRYDTDLIISKIGYRDLIIPRDKILNKGILGFNVFLQDWSIEFKENICDTINVKTISQDTLIMDKCLFIKNIKSTKTMICE